MVKNKKGIMVCMLLIVFILIAIFIKLGWNADFEAFIYSHVIANMSTGLTEVVKFITFLGNWYSIVIVCLVLLIIPKTRKNIALPVIITAITSSLLNSLLKNIFVRERPSILRLVDAGGYSFPSGHSMNNAALYTMLILVIFKYIHNKYVSYGLSILCVALIVAIGVSRIYLGAHYPTDVIAGWIMGISVALTIYSLYYEVKNKKV